MNVRIIALWVSCWLLWPVSGWSRDAAADISDTLGAIQVLDLQTAQELALAANPTLEAAMARVEQAKARVGQAAAVWWPSLDLSGSGARTRQSDNSWEAAQALAGMYGQSADRTTELYGAGLRASWLVFDGYYRKYNQVLAETGEQSAAARREDVQRLLVAAVAEAFLNAQLAQTNAEIAASDQEFYSRQQQDAQARYDAGAGSWGDVLNIKVQLNTAKTHVLLAGREFEAAGYGLAALMGLPDGHLPSHLKLEQLQRDLTCSADMEPVAQLIDEALSQRPDVRQLTLTVKEAEAVIGMAESPFYPKVQLAGSVDYVRQGDMHISSADVGNTIGLNFSWNLFSGGADRARRVEAEQARREAGAVLMNLRNQVSAEIRQAVALLEAAREQVLLQYESLKLVEENRDLAKSEYEAGQTPLLRLNEAQRDLSATHGRLALAQVGWQRAKARLQAATGRNVRMIED